MREIVNFFGIVLCGLVIMPLMSIGCFYLLIFVLNALRTLGSLGDTIVVWFFVSFFYCVACVIVSNSILARGESRV